MFSFWIAFLVDLIIGDPYWFPHPVRFIGKYISSAEKFIRKKTSTDKGLKIGGVVLTISTVLLTYLITLLILFLAAKVHIYLFIFINIILLWTTLATKCLKDESTKVYNVLKEGDLPEARKLLSYLVGRDTGELNANEVAKATLETVVENTADGVIAPLFYMFIGGAPLALAYKAINTLDSMVGYKNEKYLHLGCVSAKLDDIANYIPARITGLLLVIASGILKLDMKRSYKILLRDRKNHSSPNCGYPEAATAGALGIQLGGAHYYFGELVHKPTIGDNTREVTYEDIKLSNKLMYVSSIVALVLFSLIYLPAYL